METVLVIVGIYLVIGFFKAGAHIDSGKVGTEGRGATFLTVMLLWPIV